ncbi:MAG: S-formylglutathione hydrolase [Burkholderiales bacterium]|jgi:S-formylglutathione hydrolase|nr:S-formylglutathione hydrolase [Burkholderiales bacterium]
MQILKSSKCFGGEVRFYEHDSLITKTKMRFSVFLPLQANPPVSCMLWLSGLTCTEENFIIKAGAQKYLADKNIMLLCPDTSPRGLTLPYEHESDDFGSGASFYLSASTPGYKDHYDMYNYINNELYNLIKTEFISSNAKISICGHSMGGHGALVIGLKNPYKYYKISAFAPIVNPSQCPWGQKAFNGYLGNDKEEWKIWDATELIKSGFCHPQPIIIEQGLSDPFLEKQLLTENFAKVCEDCGQTLQVNYHEGYDHSYWFIASFIEWHI